MILEEWDKIYEAIEKGDVHKAYFLLKNEKNVDVEDERGRTFLMAAISSDNLDMVKMIVKLGADIEKKNIDGLTSYLFACKTTNNVEIIDYLMDCGADIKVKDNYDDNALFIASEYNHNPDIVQRLTKIYDVNSQEDKYRCSPLMVAARFNDVWVLRVLIECGADVHLKDKGGATALMYAAANEYDNPTNLIALAALGSDIYAKNNEGQVLPEIADLNGNYDIRDVCQSLLYLIRDEEIPTPKKKAKPKYN